MSDTLSLIRPPMTTVSPSRTSTVVCAVRESTPAAPVWVLVAAVTDGWLMLGLMLSRMRPSALMLGVTVSWMPVVT